MKKYAFYLPQFHEIEENNKWWGKGFTEWVNVKNAKPLFKNHKQPKVPIDGYYDLLKKETVIHQTELINKYNLDGLIYYHYYFKGKKLLEKPAENLLKWKDIPQNFFFCWANHSWIRSWEGNSTMLQEQTYGTIEDWEEHFNYLLPFFKDNRYVKRNNKPLFMIFKSNFEEKNQMFDYFNKKCIENGFDGIIIINTCNILKEYHRLKKNKTNYESMYFFREPSFSMNESRGFLRKSIDKIKKIAGIKYKPFKIYDGNKFIKTSIRKYFYDSRVIHGLFFEWDNTPRHGKRGYVIKPISKKYFNKYINVLNNEEYVFINAWNEWAEGMILEGTKENGFKYLEWISEIR